MEDDVSVLFATDPMGLTKDGPEIAAIVAEYRQRRHLFKTQGQSAATKKASLKKSLVASLAKDVKDLGGDF